MTSATPHRCRAQHHERTMRRLLSTALIALRTKGNGRARYRGAFVQGNRVSQFRPASNLDPVQCGAAAQVHHLAVGGDQRAAEHAFRFGQFTPLEQVPQPFFPGGLPCGRRESGLQGVRHGFPLLADVCPVGRHRGKQK